MPDQPGPDAAAPPPPLTRFTLDSAYAHALLLPLGRRSLARDPAPFPAVVRCINPHLPGARR